MASRAKQKEEARERRLAEERARAERSRRQRRIQMTLGIVLGAVAVIAVAIAVSSGGGGGKGLQKGTKLSGTESAVSGLLTGIPQSGATLGKSSAPVTMTYYGDLECPICQAFTLTGGFSQLVSNDIRNGKVKVQYKAFETATRDATVFQTQQVAALAAGKQNKFWNFAELFYHEQGTEDTSYVTDAYLTSLAQQIPGLNLATWRTDRNNAALSAQVTSDEKDGSAAGVTGTPTLVFTGPKGSTALGGVPTYSNLEGAIKKVA
jgi:protein-disulfide isomerase